MSKTYHRGPRKSTTMKREDSYSGWEGEGSSPAVRKTNKDRAHRHSRQCAKRQLAEILSMAVR